MKKLGLTNPFGFIKLKSEDSSFHGSQNNGISYIKRNTLCWLMTNGRNKAKDRMERHTIRYCVSWYVLISKLRLCFQMSQMLINLDLINPISLLFMVQVNNTSFFLFLFYPFATEHINFQYLDKQHILIRSTK